MERDHEAKFVQQALEMKRAYYRYMSHEIRTPLSVASLGLGLIESELDGLLNEPNLTNLPDQDLFSNLRHCKEAIESAVSILTELIDNEKLESKLVKLEGEYLSFPSVLSSVIGPFSLMARQKKILLLGEVSLDPMFVPVSVRGSLPSPEMTLDSASLGRIESLARVHADPSKLSQVVRNLLSNALKFTPEGGEVRVEVSYLSMHDPRVEELNLNSNPHPFKHLSPASDPHPIKPQSPFHYLSTILSFSSLPFQLPFPRPQDTSSPLPTSSNVPQNPPPSSSYPDIENNLRLSSDHIPISLSPPRSRSTSILSTSYHNPSANRPSLASLPQSETSTQTKSVSSSVAPTNMTSITTQNHRTTTSSSTSDFAGPTLPPQGFLLFQVIDSGAGIKKEDQARLFSEAFQISPGKLQAGGGSGLGLYNSKRIVELHGGKMFMSSEGEGKGCTFSFSLPVYTPSESTVTVTEKDSEATLMSHSSNLPSLNENTQSNSSQPTTQNHPQNSNQDVCPDQSPRSHPQNHPPIPSSQITSFELKLTSEFQSNKQPDLSLYFHTAHEPQDKPPISASNSTLAYIPSLNPSSYPSSSSSLASSRPSFNSQKSLKSPSTSIKPLHSPPSHRLSPSTSTTLSFRLNSSTHHFSSYLVTQEKQDKYIFKFNFSGGSLSSKNGPSTSLSRAPPSPEQPTISRFLPSFKSKSSSPSGPSTPMSSKYLLNGLRSKRITPQPPSTPPSSVVRPFTPSSTFHDLNPSTCFQPTQTQTPPNPQTQPLVSSFWTSEKRRLTPPSTPPDPLITSQGNPDPNLHPHSPISTEVLEMLSTLDRPQSFSTTTPQQHNKSAINSYFSTSSPGPRSLSSSSSSSSLKWNALADEKLNQSAEQQQHQYQPTKSPLIETHPPHIHIPFPIRFTDSKGGPRISRTSFLLIEDTEMIRKLTRKTLEARQSGNRVYEAENGSVALSLVRERMSAARRRVKGKSEEEREGGGGGEGEEEDWERGEGEFGVVLLDSDMPVLDGPQTVCELRSLGYRGLVVGLTGNVVKGDVDHFILCGANAVLEKPLNYGKLVEATKNFLASNPN